MMLVSLQAHLMMHVSLQAHLPRLAPFCMNQPVHPVCMLYLQALLHTRMAGPTVEPHSGVGSPRETLAALGGRGWLRCAVRVPPRVAKS